VSWPKAHQVGEVAGEDGSAEGRPHQPRRRKEGSLPKVGMTGGARADSCPRRRRSARRRAAKKRRQEGRRRLFVQLPPVPGEELEGEERQTDKGEEMLAPVLPFPTKEKGKPDGNHVWLASRLWWRGRSPCRTRYAGPNAQPGSNRLLKPGGHALQDRRAVRRRQGSPTTGKGRFQTPSLLRPHHKRCCTGAFPKAHRLLKSLGCELRLGAKMLRVDRTCST